ncbi:MAG: hypothetical protein IPN69_11035 [Acidobacteria bacterium]|nr:hypothetical protein [Acidobacteriota bacterium]
MKRFRISIATVLLALLAVTSVFPCGPGYVTPVFDNERAPETPYRDFAAGNLGIVKPSYRRMVLIAAYRYLTGGGFSDPEQRALVEFWEAEINNKSYDRTDELETAVKAWVEQRKAVVGTEEKTPEIYVERSWGGYDFFPNCTKNAFETAAKTLADRAMSHGSDDKDVKNWLRAQDQVFNNCANGKSIPAEPSAEMAEWLLKDRAYQIAAAQFYSLDYGSARRKFEEIAQDPQSPWQETAEYLIGRTLIRQASLNNDKNSSEAFYYQADQALQTVVSKGGRFSEDAERLLGVVKYRLRPQERVHELANTVAYQGNANFRQDLIDYTWLLDKYEKEALETEEKRKAEIEARNNPNANTSTVTETPTPEPASDKLTLYIYTEDTQQSYTIEVSVDATDEDAFAAAERIIGKSLTKDQKEALRTQRQSAFASRFTDRRDSGYQGGYWGNETMSVGLLPEFLRQDEISDWLFTYQIQSPEAYNYALSKYRQTGSDLWLMTAISKADSTSAELPMIVDKARRTPTTSPAFATIFYHLARIDLAQGKTAEARELLDELIASPVNFPVSTRNQFLKLRMTLSETLDEFLKTALRKPYAFDFDGSIGSIDEQLAEQKTWWSPEAYPDQTREQYEKELDERFAEYRTFESEKTFDDDALSSFNRYFPTDAMIAAERSEAIPTHLRRRLALAIWMRAVLLDNEPAAKQITPRLLAQFPDLADDFIPYQKALTPVARKRSAIFIILKNPILTPAIQSGFGADNVFGEWDDDNWWCSWYFDSENEDPAVIGKPPVFLTRAQIAAAKLERSRLSRIGDAPKYFAEQTLEWARLAPADKRVPEALYIAWASNGWTKYGCGNGPETQEEIAAVMRKRYPNSDWTKKLDENQEQ